MSEAKPTSETREQAAFWKQNTPKLIELIAEGLTTREIAEKLGVSKNAVIGRARRANLLFARSPDFKPKPPAQAWDFPGAGRCLWPHGNLEDKHFHFCGEKAEPERVYCAEHWARAHIKIKGEEREAA